MNWELIPLIGIYLKLYWDPILYQINTALYYTNLLYADVAIPVGVEVLLLVLWIIIRVRRKRRLPKVEGEGVEEAVEEIEGEELSDEEIEAELAGEFAEDEEAFAEEEAEEVVEKKPAPPPKVEKAPPKVEKAPPPKEEKAPPPKVEKAPPKVEVPPPPPPPPPKVEEPPLPPPKVEEPPPPPKLSLFQRLRAGLAKTSAGLVGKIDAILSGKSAIDDDLYTDLEEALITADIGIQTAYKLLENTQKLIKERGVTNPAEIRPILKEQVLEILKTEEIPLQMTAEKPFVIMVVGVNGVGKTTTIGKIASKYKQDGKTVLIAAADTFRAAAIEQLEVWAERVGCEIIKQAAGTDPSAVAYDAMKAGVARNADVVIVDTAGRLHTKANLMEELKKIKRVMTKIVPTAPHETVLVLDATTGQNAINQAKVFNEAIELSGLILTKLDGTSKGGCIVGICDELHVPIRYIGIGEKIDDLRPFAAKDFVDAMFEEDDGRQ